MKHISEQQLVFYYYGDAERPREIESHLAACADCRSEFSKIEKTLAQVMPTEVPEPAADYEAALWKKLEPRLESAKKPGWWTAWLTPKLGWAGSAAVLIIAAFLAGRYLPRPGEHGQPTQIVETAQPNTERIILVAVGEHLERSQVLLVELMSADGKGTTDLSTEQKQARDLLDANRLYRQSAQKTGDPAISRTLDELERVLVEVANGPSEVSEKELKEIRQRIEAQGLLFKIRVVGSKVQKQAETRDAGTRKL